MIWNDPWTQGRFRANEGWKPEFKGYKSLLWFLSEELRNGISYNGNQLNIDYSKDDNENITIEVSIPEREDMTDTPIYIPMRQDGDWEQPELNDIIKTFRSTGILRKTNVQEEIAEQS